MSKSGSGINSVNSILFILSFILSLAILSISILPLAIAQASIGTVDGYIWDFMPNTPLANATVTVTIGGSCSSNCFAQTISEPSGYYVVTNLDFASGRPITVVASTGNYYGTNSGAAINGFTPIQINVTTCEAPSTPALINPPSNNHSNTLFTLAWTSGSDPQLNPTYDDLIFDNVLENNAVSPVEKTNLAYGIGGGNRTYAWSILTCNAQCCSAPAQSSFVLVNTIPQTPTLTPVSDGVSTQISFEWSTVLDLDGDTVTYDLYLNGNIINNVTSPHLENFVTGAHTWGVRACDHIGCSTFAYDSFSITNNAPTPPVLTLQPNSQTLLRQFIWNSVLLDGDGDPVHDEFYLSTDSSFSSFVNYSLNATSPYDYLLVSDTIYYWRVRSCDNQGACSAYTSDIFFTFTCPTCLSGGGEGGTGSNCIEEWSCTSWGSCGRGMQLRVCTDTNSCAKVPKPVEHQVCSVRDLIVPLSAHQPKPGDLLGDRRTPEFFLVNFDEVEDIDVRIGFNEIWNFIFDGSSHIMQVVAISEGSIKLLISSNPTYFADFSNGDERRFDLTGDGIADLLVRFNGIEGTKAAIQAKRISPGPVEKIIAQPLHITKETLGKYWPLHVFVYVLALVEIAIGIAMARTLLREKKVDAQLMQYIATAKNKGFTDNQIQKKLADTGWAKEEIDWAYKQIKK